jgi:hypothetical protein
MGIQNLRCEHSCWRDIACPSLIRQPDRKKSAGLLGRALSQTGSTAPHAARSISAARLAINQATPSGPHLPSSLIFWYTKLMTNAISRTRKTRGRPRTGAESIHLRVLPDQYAAIDAWIAKQKEPDLSRPEAIRRLVDLGLKAKSK